MLDRNWHGEDSGGDCFQEGDGMVWESVVFINVEICEMW